MSEVASLPTVSLAEIYNSIVSAGPDVRTSSRNTKVKVPLLDDAEIDRQCREIDELWCELGNCVHHWRGYPVEFIATRFANMHYVRQTSIGSAYPPDDVWTYLCNKIHDQVHGKVVVMRHAQHTPGEIRSWR